MDWWSLLENLLGSQPGNEQLHRVVLILSGCANFVALAGALYGLWRWWTSSGRNARAADALRDEGKHRAQLNQPKQAMALFDLSIRLNPRAGHAYYLRGCLKEDLELTNRAITDWKRCLHRHPKHAAATQKLAQYGVTEAGSGLPSWAIATATGVGVVVVIVLAGSFAL